MNTAPLSLSKEGIYQINNLYERYYGILELGMYTGIVSKIISINHGCLEAEIIYPESHWYGENDKDFFLRKIHQLILDYNWYKQITHIELFEYSEAGEGMQLHLNEQLNFRELEGEVYRISEQKKQAIIEFGNTKEFFAKQVFAYPLKLFP